MNHGARVAAAGVTGALAPATALVAAAQVDETRVTHESDFIAKRSNSWHELLLRSISPLIFMSYTCFTISRRGLV